MLRSSKTIKGTDGPVFENILMPRRIVVDSTAVDPLEYEGSADDDLYTIPAGTVMVPVSASNGAYIALQRSPYASKTESGGNTLIVVDDASPFRLADTIRYRDVSDDYTVVAIGAITAIDYDTQTLTVAGSVATAIAADDPVEVSYLDADMVILEDSVCVQDGNDTLHDTVAVGVIGGQVEASKLNMVGDWDELLALEMPHIDFIPVEPGTGTNRDASVAAGELDDDITYREAVTDVTTGDITATIATRAVAIAHGAGVISNAGFRLANTGADGTDDLAAELDVTINGTTIFTTKPVITDSATDGADTFAAATGVTPGVIDAAANIVADGDVIAYVWTLTRTTPEDEVADLLVFAEVEYKAGS